METWHKQQTAPVGEPLQITLLQYLNGATHGTRTHNLRITNLNKAF